MKRPHNNLKLHEVKAFWNNVMALRVRQGIKRPEFAKDLGIPIKTYEGLEYGCRKTLDLNLAERIALKLNTTVEQLLDSTGQSEDANKPHIFWQQARSRRIELDMTVEDVAGKLGMSHQSYLLRELGSIKTLTNEEAEKIAEVLETTVDALMSEATTAIVMDELTDSEKAFIATPEGRELIRQLTRQWEENQRSN